VMCIHREAAYQKNCVLHDLSHSEIAQDNTILLPFYPQMGEEQQKQVILALKEVLTLVTQESLSYVT